MLLSDLNEYDHILTFGSRAKITGISENVFTYLWWAVPDLNHVEIAIGVGLVSKSSILINVD